MTSLEKFFEIVQSDDNLFVIFEQLGYEKDYFDETEFRETVQTAQDICNHGISGGFSGFIYYFETVDFFNRNEMRITDYFEDCFVKSEFLELIREKLDIADIVEHTHYAINFYVWLYVELVLNAFYDDINTALEGE